MIGDNGLMPPTPPALNPHHGFPIPDDEQCFRWWDDFEMLDNIREHSMQVAFVAEAIAKASLAKGLDVCVASTRASGLLHDLAKTFTIKHGGNHCQIGAAWTVDISGNPAIAQGVVHHVFWPYEIDVCKYFLPLVVQYADKRVRHNEQVFLDERFEDLYERYGTTEDIRYRIRKSKQQALVIERGLGKILGVKLGACTFDSRGLVPGT